MLDKDKAALTDRLFDNMDIEALQLLVENQPDEDIDETQVWCRWVINPGVSRDTALGSGLRVYQEGTASLQIFVPKGLYTGPGDDVREQFNTLFRGWRSDDRKLVVDNLKSQQSIYSRNGQEFYLINAMLMWHSTRNSTDQ